MHKHYNNGPLTVRQARKRHCRSVEERLTTVMVWAVYGWMITVGVFLRLAGWM